MKFTRNDARLGNSSELWYGKTEKIVRLASPRENNRLLSIELSLISCDLRARFFPLYTNQGEIPSDRGGEFPHEIFLPKMGMELKVLTSEDALLEAH